MVFSVDVVVDTPRRACGGRQCIGDDNLARCKNRRHAADIGVNLTRSRNNNG